MSTVPGGGGHRRRVQVATDNGAHCAVGNLAHWENAPFTAH